MNNPSIQYLYILTNSLYEQLSIRQINLLIWIKPGLIKIKPEPTVTITVVPLV